MENLVVRDAFLNNFEKSAFITLFEKGEIGRLSLDGVDMTGGELIDDSRGKIAVKHIWQ